MANSRKTLSWLPDYDISRCGEVRRISWAKTRPTPPYIVSGSDSGRGYLRVKLLLSNGVKKSLFIHRLVCEAFHGPAPAGETIVAHWDGNPRNNHADNLRWTDAAGNGRDAARLGEVAGRKNGRAKITEHQAKEIFEKYSGEYGQVAKLARAYGLSHSATLSICKGENWRAVNVC